MSNFLAFMLRLFYTALLLPLFLMAIIPLFRSMDMINPAVATLAGMMFGGGVGYTLAHVVLSRLGERRFNELDRLGWLFLESNDAERLAKIFGKMEQLLGGGLLIGQQRRRCYETHLRRYIAFYIDHVDHGRYRAGLLYALRANICAQESFQALKEYVMGQSELTIELADIAEILFEHRPDDPELVKFMAQAYAERGQMHYRAEKFYLYAYALNLDIAAKIAAVYAERLLETRRTDDFAARHYLWLLHHAAQGPPHLAQRALFDIAAKYDRLGRQDELGRLVREAVAAIDPALAAEWKAEAQARAEQQLGQRFSRLRFAAQQKLLYWWGEIKRRPAYFYSSLAAVLFIGMVYLLLPAPGASDGDKALQQEIAAASEKKQFAVQVAATKSARSAQREIARLSKMGLSAYLVKPDRKNGWYRIRVGPYETRRQAQAKGEELRRKKAIREFFTVNYDPAH